MTSPALILFLAVLCSACGTMRPPIVRPALHPKVGDILIVGSESVLYVEEMVDPRSIASGQCLLRKSGRLTIVESDGLSYVLRYHHGGDTSADECAEGTLFVDDLRDYSMSARDSWGLAIYDHEYASMPRVIRSRTTFRATHAR